MSWKSTLIFCIALLILGAVWWAYPYWISYLPLAQSISSAEGQNIGVYGDQFGAFTALFSGLAFFGLIFAITIQHKELNETKGQLEKQAFQSLFVMALNSYRENVKTIELPFSDSNWNGRVAQPESGKFFGTEAIRGSLRWYARVSVTNSNGQEQKQLQQEFSSFPGAVQSLSEKVFRSFVDIFDLLQTENISKKDKALFSRIAVSSLSYEEMSLIAHVAVLNDDKQEEAAALIESGFFKNLPYEVKKGIEAQMDDETLERLGIESDSS